MQAQDSMSSIFKNISRSRRLHLQDDAVPGGMLMVAEAETTRTGPGPYIRWSGKRAGSEHRGVASLSVRVLLGYGMHMISDIHQSAAGRHLLKLPDLSKPKKNVMWVRSRSGQSPSSHRCDALNPAGFEKLPSKSCLRGPCRSSGVGLACWVRSNSQTSLPTVFQIAILRDRFNRFPLQLCYGHGGDAT